MRQGEPEVVFQTPNIRAVLERLKEVSPKVARDVRRELRGTGDQIIARQREILAGPLPQGIVRTGSKIKLTTPTGRKGYLRRVNTYAERDVVRPGRSTDLRKKISAGLTTSVVAGKTRQGIQIKTRGPRDAGYNMAKVWQSRMFRHPVFNRDVWVDQQGQPFFWGPVIEGRDAMLDEATDILNNAFERF